MLTCYDDMEGRKTRDLVAYDEGFAIVWGPELNPMRSLVLEESEPPEAHRWGEVMYTEGGRAMTQEEREAAVQAIELNLDACNYTSGCSRVWLGLRGGAQSAAAEKGGQEQEEEG